MKLNGSGKSEKGNYKDKKIRGVFSKPLNLDPTAGHEFKKSRPCVIISPDDMNILKTVIVGPMTTVIRNFPFRVNIDFEEKKAQVALDQIRSVVKIRLIKKLGVIENRTANEICKTLVQIFSY